MRLLIVKLSALGDVVQTLPSLTLLKKYLPSAKVDWVVDERNAGILKGHPFIENLIVFSKSYLNSFAKLKDFVKNLRSHFYEFAIDYQGLFKSGVITGFSRSQKKVGFSNSRELSWIFYNTKLPAYDPELHAVKRYLLLTKEVLKMCKINVQEKDIPKVVWQKEFLEPRMLKGNYIVIVPGARWKTKLWELSHWRKFVLDFKKVFPEIEVIISGTKGEIEIKKWAEEVEKEVKGVSSFVGKISLSNLVNLLAYARCIITVDTGPMHIASALKVPIVALFGPTSEQRTGPWSPVQEVITADIPCRPCFKKKCPHKNCMKEISPEKVVETTCKLINS